MSKITLKNTSSSEVTLILSGINFRRVMRPGRVIPLTYAQYEEILADAGAHRLVEEHYLTIEGVDEDEAIEILTDDVYDTVAIAKMFDTKDYTGFAKFIPNAADAEKDTVVKLAVEKKVTDNAFVALIKQYCGVDIINAINVQHQVDEK